MAASSGATTDQEFENMKNLAIEQQQCFYEILDDCLTYKPDEHKYLKQNIGFALYGPPRNDENTDATESNVHCNTENQSEDADITDTVNYNEEASAYINKIYDKICEYTIGTNCDKPIYFAIIYNVVVCPKRPNETNETDDNGFKVIPIPIFKIWKNTEKKIYTTEGKKGEEVAKLIKTNEEYEILYIDTSSRVYKNWEDYKEYNNLFECKMILPKDGLYQANPSCPITEDYSTVWLEIMDSPACSLTAKIVNGVDVASTVTGGGALVVGLASLFTPLAPVVIAGGAVATGVTAAWAMARGTQQLVDRSLHEESINPLDREAFPQWLTITGSAFGLGAMGGTVALSSAVSRGITVNTAARLAFNTVQGGNLFLNGVGIIYQGYCMVDRYMTDETFSYLDAVNLATHLMFFAGTVVHVQFAGDIIQSNQNKIMDDYRDSLRSKRLRKRFNRIRRRAAANNVSPMSENAEVIRYINNRNQLITNVSNAPNVSSATSSNVNTTSNSANSAIWKIENGILMINGIALLDPIEFVARLIRSGMSADFNQSDSSSSSSYENDCAATQLWSILDTLLGQYLSATENPSCNINSSEFIPLLREMDSLNVNQNVLEKLFTITIKLMQRCRNQEERLLKIMRFVWLYCKTNLKQWGINTCLRMQSIAGFNILHQIITVLLEVEEFDKLYLALEMYLLTDRLNIN